MRKSISLCIVVIALYSIGCSSQTDPQAEENVTDAVQQIDSPLSEATVDTYHDAPEWRAADDSVVVDEEFDLSDLDDIAPASLTALTSRPNSMSSPRPGFASHQNDWLPSKPAFQVASRDARGKANPPPTPAQPQAIDPNLPTNVELREASKRDLDRIIDSFHGKVVFVDFWASWCGPCVGSFPQTVRMHRLAHQHDLRVITVSLDKPAQKRSVLRFLESHGATCVNLLAKNGGILPVTYDFGIPGGSIPHFKLFDRQGTQRHDWTGAGPDVARDILRRVVELLRET